MSKQVVDDYRAGAEALTRAVAGLVEAELDAEPVAGTWSIRQIVAHLADSDLIGAERMKRVIAMEEPTLLAYDQDAFAERLFYETQDVVLSCRLFALNREMMARILEQLPAEAFERVGHHTEDGRETLGELVSKYVWHLSHHLGFLHRKRELLGKPLN